MKYTIIDIETDGLLETATLIHCLSYQIFEDGELVSKGSLTDYNDISYFIQNQSVLVGHNIIRYDIPVLKKILRLENELIHARLIDTLALSWYLYPNRIKHGLELWGDDLGVPKPEINDWENLTIEEYKFRCESDVEINQLLFHKQLKYLDLLYGGDYDDIVNYLMFKLDCAREQEEVKCKLDVPLCKDTLDSLYIIRDTKVAALTDAMPRDIKYKEVNRPTNLYKMNGDFSVKGRKWLDILEEHNLPEDWEEPVMVEKSSEPGNPKSSIQLKNWLDILGWQPRLFESRKNTRGEVKEVPQIYDGEEVCDSIKELFLIEPALQNLNSLSIVNHRIGILEGYLEKVDDDGFIQATVAGFTNTLRFKHSKPLVNLPSIYKPYGNEVRGALMKPSNEHLLCGSDMSSLEDTTKQHYMYFFDAEYVTQMRVPGFDPHLDIAVLAGMMSEEDSTWFKAAKKRDLNAEEKERFSALNSTRSHAKTVNFAGVYGAGPAKIAKTLGKPLSFAKKLHKTYWERNNSVKQVSNSITIRIIYKDGKVRDMPSSKLNRIPRQMQDEFFSKIEQMWLKNPVSGFYYSLRYPKDIFSTLNQGSGVYCFDLWVREVRKSGIKISMQYHDEIMFSLLAEDKELTEKKLKDAIAVVNEQVKLNVPLGISVDIGDNYAEIH